MKNFLGAFADGAILFPIIAALSIQSGFSGTLLLATAGVAYLVAGWDFKVPMSVQPLKAIAIAAVAIGATSSEIRVSGAALGLLCLLLSQRSVERLAQRIPASWVHAVQLGIGVVLMRQGLKFGFGADHEMTEQILAGTVTAGLLLCTALFEFPVLGLAATAGIAFAVFSGFFGAGDAQSSLPSTLAAAQGGALRWTIIVSLVFPQLVLTFFNSVVATQDVARRYYGERASRVTVSRLLRSIGLGNLISAGVGGLPFCHGSGGVTAHYRGGARDWISNVYIGSALLVFALVQFLGGHVRLQYPLPLLAGLLVTVGAFHLGLAKPTWQTPRGKWQLSAAGLAAALTQNMLWVLAMVVVFEGVCKVLSRGKPQEVSV